MNNHRPQRDSPRFDGTSGGLPSNMADGRRRLPAWNREELIRQFQGIDGSTRSEAEQQIDTYERTFLTIVGDSSVAAAAQGSAREWSEIPGQAKAAGPANAVRSDDPTPVERGVHGKTR